MKVTVYSTATCSYCAMLKGWLDDNKIEYTERRVDTDLAAAQEMVQKSGQMSVPFSVVEYDDGTSHGILGFDRLSFEEAVAQAG